MMEYFSIINDSKEYKNDLSTFNSDDITLIDGDLFIGLYKPFNNLFFQLGTVSPTSISLTYQYFNGVAYQDLVVTPSHKGFQRDGRIDFTTPDNWVQEEILASSGPQYYIKISGLISPITFKGIGVLFSEDRDIVAVKNNIVSTLNNGETWIKKHEQAKKEIIQELRNMGHIKVINKNIINPILPEGGFFSDLTEHDILDRRQLELASVYKTMALIYLDELTDEADDKYERRGRRYSGKYSKAMELYFLKLDLNDDGKEENFENFQGEETSSLTWS